MIILGLKNILSEDADARRLFGKKELEIMLKQLDGFLLKQSERNRLSRDIRPKLEFIKEIAKFQDEFRLEKNQENKRIIEKTVGTILKDELGKDTKAILLFGSFADKSFTKRSDIDICTIFRQDISPKEATKFRIRVSGQLPEKVDIQVFNVVPQKVKREIARNHRVLYSTNDYDNTGFSIRYMKDEDYFIRVQKIFGATA